MKICPSCGYKDTPTEKQLLKQYKKAFPDLPVRAMIKRQWLNVSDLASVDEVRVELIRFFELKCADDLEDLLAARQQLF